MALRFIFAVCLLFAAFPALAQTVVPKSCPIVTVTTGGTAVKAIPSKVNGAVIVNPATATESLFVDQTKTATTTEAGTNFPLAAGQPWYVVPGAYNAASGAFNGVSVNAVTSAHSYFCIMW